MSEKITPATKKVGKSDGIPDGPQHSTITTPKALQMRLWGDKKAKGSMFGKS